MKGSNNGNGSLTGFAARTGKKSRDWLVRSMWEIKGKATSTFEQAEDTVRREKEIARREAREIASVHDLNR